MKYKSKNQVNNKKEDIQMTFKQFFIAIKLVFKLSIKQQLNKLVFYAHCHRRKSRLRQTTHEGNVMTLDIGKKVIWKSYTHGNMKIQYTVYMNISRNCIFIDHFIMFNIIKINFRFHFSCNLSSCSCVQLLPVSNVRLTYSYRKQI